MEKLISVRMDDELWEKVHQRAEENERSLSREVIFILKNFFSTQSEQKKGHINSGK